MPTTLHFTKTIKEVREYQISRDLTYDEFVETYMAQMDDESDEDFKKRCDEVWEALCDQRETGKHAKGDHIDLGEKENDCGEFDDWEGDEEEEIGDDIQDIVEMETKQLHPHYIAWVEKTRQEARAKIEEQTKVMMAKDKQIADLRKRLAELTA